MITIKKSTYTSTEKNALYLALQAAVDEFINTSCNLQGYCNTCAFRRVCIDLIQARDYAYKIALEGDR